MKRLFAIVAFLLLNIFLASSASGMPIGQSLLAFSLKIGRDSFSYLTNKGNFSALQTHIELALTANRALPNIILKINTTGMNPEMIRRATGNWPGYGADEGTVSSFLIKLYRQVEFQ